MNEQERLINDLVIANRILANEDVVDAYGHVSIRNPKNPNTFFMARSLAPELVTADDIVELDLEGNPVRDETRHLYLERFIHGGILEARPDVMAVVHAHAEEILPFGIANGTPLRPVRDLAATLADNNVALMRGHGFAAAARSLIEVVRMSVYLPRNARALSSALRLGGEIKSLSQGEIDARNRGYKPYSPETWRAWEYWGTKCGCGHMLSRPDTENA
jgi:HCOMODA/2-hydroxy-3-carboxy-muconic semialdehyde decarboxylase